MISGGELLAGVAAPFLAATGLGLAARLPRPGTGAWAGAALALGAACGHAALATVQHDAVLAPRNGYQWACWYAVAVGAVLLIPLRTLPRIAFLALAGAGFWTLAILPLHPHRLPTPQAWLAGAVLLSAGLASGGLIEAGLRVWRPLPSLLAGTAALSGGALAIALAGSLVMGQLAGTAGAAAGGLALAWLLAKQPPAGSGWAIGALLTAHLGSNLTWLYSDLQWPAAALVAGALPLAWSAHLPGLAARPRAQAAVRWGAVALALIAALAWTALRGQPPTAAGGGGAEFSY